METLRIRRVGGPLAPSLIPSFCLWLSLALLETRVPTSPSAPRPRGLNIWAPPTAPAQFPQVRWAPGSPRPARVPWGWLSSLSCRGRQSPGFAFGKGFAFFGRWGRWPRSAAVPGFLLALGRGRDRSAGNVSRLGCCCLWPLGRLRPPGRQSLCETEETALLSRLGAS